MKLIDILKEIKIVNKGETISKLLERGEVFYDFVAIIHWIDSGSNETFMDYMDPGVEDWNISAASLLKTIIKPNEIYATFFEHIKVIDFKKAYQFIKIVDDEDDTHLLIASNFLIP